MADAAIQTRASVSGDQPWKRRSEGRVGIVEIAVLWLAFGARVHALTRQSLWPDEIYSFVVSGWSLADLWSNLVHDHVPLYTILLGAWQGAAGSSEFVLRFFSVICSTAMLPLLARVGRRFLPPVPLLAAVSLVAISPFQLYFAQEAVGYSFLGFLALLVTWVFFRWLRHPPAMVVALAGLLYAALLYTHYAGFFVLATDVAVGGASVLLGWLTRRRIRQASAVPVLSARWIASWGLGFALFLPWILGHFDYFGQNLVGGSRRPLGEIVGLLLTDLSFGNVLSAHLDAGKPPQALVLHNLLLASTLLAVILLLAILPFERGSWGLQWGRTVVALHVVVPFALLLVLVQFSRDFVSRYGFPALAWVPVLAVLGLWRLPPTVRWIGVAILVGYAAWGDLIYFEHPGFARLDFRSAVQYVLERRQPGDSIIVTAPYVAPTFAYYADPRDHANPPLPTLALPDSIPLLPGPTVAQVRAEAAHRPRVWLLRWQDYYSDPRQVIGGALDSAGYHLDRRHLPGPISIDLWQTQPPLLDRLPPAARPINGSIAPIHLSGYEEALEPGNHARLTLYWTVDVPITVDETIFVHLDGPEGRTVARFDDRPYGGRFPTTQWPPAVVVRDVHDLPLPPCLPPGPYQLSVGFYHPATGQRLGPPGADTVRIPIELNGPTPSATAGFLLRRLPAPLRMDNLLPDAPPSCPV